MTPLPAGTRCAVRSRQEVPWWSCGCAGTTGTAQRSPRHLQWSSRTPRGTPLGTTQGRGLSSRERVVRSDRRRALRVVPAVALVLRGMRNAVAAARRGAKCQIPV